MDSIPQSHKTVQTSLTASTLPCVLEFLHLRTAQEAATCLAALSVNPAPGHWSDPIWHPSCNFGEKRNQEQTQPSFIILHYTELDFDQSLAVLTMPVEEAQKKLQAQGHPEIAGLTTSVSAHYLLREDGACYHLVQDLHRAWHAGVSTWTDAGGRCFNGMNDYSIGIEIVNAGDPSHAYPAAQIEALAGLCWLKMREFKIPIKNLLGHDQIAPGRKFDPGVHFPWEWLRACITTLQKDDQTRTILT